MDAAELDGAGDVAPDALTSILKCDDTFALCSRRGDIADHPHRGLYHNGMRYLSLQRLDFSPPLMVLSSTINPHSGAAVVHLTNHESLGSHPLARESVHIERRRILGDGEIVEQLRIENLTDRPIPLHFQLQWDADFHDVFEVRGARRQQRGQLVYHSPAIGELQFAYLGLDHIWRRTLIKVSPEPNFSEDRTMHFLCELPPRARKDWLISVDCHNRRQERKAFAQAEDEAREHLRRKQATFATVETSNLWLNQWLQQSRDDLCLLATGHEPLLLPHAGVPWFATTFGRDSIIAALQTLWLNPSLAKGVLTFLAATQATTNDGRFDAEPGKILHEMRLGEMANRNEVPFGLYYGSVDSTPLFVILAAQYFERSADESFAQEIWPAVMKALLWMDMYGDPDRDGFVEYLAQSPSGLNQQGWKDSSNSVFHEDGSDAPAPTALCEVQGYVYQAKVAAAKMAQRLGHRSLHESLLQSAERLRTQFHEKMWDQELHSVVLALDGLKRPCRVLTSNAGHCLFSGILGQDQASSLMQTLMSARLMSGWGVRTLGTDQARFNPLSYHNGSVWPHDNSLIAAGLARYGFKEQAEILFQAQFAAARALPAMRLPELFAGFERQEGEGPVPIAQACSLQAWAAGSVFLYLQSLLGIHIEACERQVRLIAPRLPQGVEQLSIHGLVVADTRVNLCLRQDGAAVAVDFSCQDESVQLVLE